LWIDLNMGWHESVTAGWSIYCCASVHFFSFIVLTMWWWWWWWGYNWWVIIFVFMDFLSRVVQ
jgi:hypothetical protein